MSQSKDLANFASIANALYVSVEANTSALIDLTISNTITISGGMVANGSLGTDGQVLTSNGTVVYWNTVSSGITTGKAIAMAIVFG